MCAGRYLTRDCNQGNTTTPKCINYQRDHPVSYQSCEVAKELQKKRMGMKNERTMNQQQQFYIQNIENIHIYLDENSYVKLTGEMEMQIARENEKYFAHVFKTKGNKKKDIDVTQVLNLI